MTPRFALLQVVRGLLMGGADIIPGVSGGTIALILGIYERLVAAISHFDLRLLGHLKGRRWRAAVQHVDLGFLVTLFFGIGVGVVSLATLMHYLLEHHMGPTFAGFFGMILASSLIVARFVGDWHSVTIAICAVGIGTAFWLVGLPFLENPPDSLVYLFVCGMIAICAMILPGISGAFILLIMGKYFDVTGVLKGFANGEFTGEAMQVVLVFGAGAIVGIIGFSKLLRVLLRDHHAWTMALLAGFMLGSLRKLWPFKTDLTPEQTEFKLKQFDNVLPDFGTSTTWLTLLIGAIGLVLVLCLDRVSSTQPRTANHG